MAQHPTKREIFDKESWLGGPTHHFQKQHIPGYQGHVQSLSSEGLFAKSFAKLTSNCLENRVEKGFIIDEKQRFSTTNRQEFTQPDLRKTQLTQTAEQLLRDYKERTAKNEEIIEKIINQGPKTIEDVPPIDRVPVIGYMGFRPVFRHPLREIKKPAVFHDKDPSKFANLSEGFQKQMLENEKFREKVKPLDCPVVGYTGFVPGIKAENKYGRNFHDTTHGCLQEKIVLK